MSKLWSIKKATNLIFKDSKFVFNLKKHFLKIEFKWSWHEQVQFNTDLLEYEAHNLYTNGRLDAKVFKGIN